MKSRDLLKALYAAGFVEVKSQGGRRRKGSHIKLRHPDGRWTVISRGDCDFSKAYVMDVAKQAGIKIDWS